jgi:hypothetical protein
VQTQAFPQGLLDKQGISLRQGGHSALDQNESLMRHFSRGASRSVSATSIAEEYEGVCA